MFLNQIEKTCSLIECILRNFEPRHPRAFQRHDLPAEDRQVSDAVPPVFPPARNGVLGFANERQRIANRLQEFFVAGQRVGLAQCNRGLAVGVKRRSVAFAIVVVEVSFE